MPRKVTITTGARLHFGPLSFAPERGRHFGGVGLMIDRPNTVLSAELSDTPNDIIVADDAARDRTGKSLDQLRESSAATRNARFRIELSQTIPSHAGLGSGTQLAMALAEAVALLSGEPAHDPAALAQRVGRGARSAIGIHGFARGGLLLDGGKSGPDSIGTIVSRVDVPADWRFVLITPTGEAGLSGAAESDAFARLRAMPQSTTERLCRIALMDLLPAVIAADFAAAGDALYEYGRTVGEFFTPVQGGTYASPAMRDLVAQLRSEGIHGIAQTSWGPTIAALCENEAGAGQLKASLSDDPRWRAYRVETAAPLNTGAAIKF